MSFDDERRQILILSDGLDKDKLQSRESSRCKGKADGFLKAKNATLETDGIAN